MQRLDTRPLDLLEFEKLLNSIKVDILKKHFGVALSGGSDSVALLILLNEFSKKYKLSLTSIIINHGLRKQSYRDSIRAQNISKEIGVSAEICNWIGTKPRSNLMSIARNHRYDLLAEKCKELRIKILFLGHHFDDQIETFLMRSKRGENNLGLACMEKIVFKNGIMMIRPFLQIPKRRLINTCKKNKISWIEDPSNSDQQFERVRIRNYLKKITFKEKIDIETKITRVKEKRNDFHNLQKIFIEKSTLIDHKGIIKVNKSDFLKKEETFKIEIIRTLLCKCSGKIYGPSFKSVKNLMNQIFIKKKNNQTLHSCTINVKNNIILFTREFSKTYSNMREDLVVYPKSTKLWDFRFFVTTETNILILKVINHKNWNFVKKTFFQNSKRTIHSSIIKSFPLICTQKNYFIPFISDMNYLKNKGITFKFKYN